MEVLDPGHRYRLQTLDGAMDVIVQFVKREGPGYPGNVGSSPGTIMQDVHRMLIDRLSYLQGQMACNENLQLINLSREAIFLLEQRAARRHDRILNFSAYDPAFDHIERLLTCVHCGHIQYIGKACHRGRQSC